MPPTRRTTSAGARSTGRRWVFISIAVVAAELAGLAITWTFFRPKPQTKILQEALAEQFGGSAAAIVANVPSRTGRYPGAVLAVTSAGAELLVRRGERPDALPPVSGAVTGARAASANIALQLAGGVFGGKLDGDGAVEVEVDLKDIRIFETAAPELAKRLRDDDGIARARANNRTLSVVTKAYEAVPKITVRQKAGARAEDWARAQAKLTQFNGRLTAQNSIVFESAVPQVLAYETSDARFLAINFGTQDAPEIKLTGRPQALTGEPPAPADFGARVAGGGTAFAVIASPAYSSFGDLPAATASAELVSGVLHVAGARQIDLGLDAGVKLTAAGFGEARRRLVEQLRTTRPKAFVLYYAGHAVSGAAGAHYLVMGDYTGRIEDDLKETSPFVPAQGATSPLAGSNVNDVARAIAAAAQELATSEKQLIAVAELHRELAAIGVPFALVIDGCFPAKAMAELREQLKFTPWGDYYGTADFPQREMAEYFRALATFGEAPYLRSSNPVIFAAKPGTVAFPVRHPYFDGDLVPEVAPLARKLFGVYAYALENRDELSMGTWLRRITDFAGTGEMDLRGTISWSDFSALGEVPMVSFAAAPK